VEIKRLEEVGESASKSASFEGSIDGQFGQSLEDNIARIRKSI